jgi:hypothetical protein
MIKKFDQYISENNMLTSLEGFPQKILFENDKLFIENVDKINNYIYDNYKIFYDFDTPRAKFDNDHHIESMNMIFYLSSKDYKKEEFLTIEENIEMLNKIKDPFKNLELEIYIEPSNNISIRVIIKIYPKDLEKNQFKSIIGIEKYNL